MGYFKYRNNTERKRARQKQNQTYKNAKQTAFTIRFHNVNDAEVIKRLKEQPNKIDYIRRLIVKDIVENG